MNGSEGWPHPNRLRAVWPDGGRVWPFVRVRAGIAAQHHNAEPFQAHLPPLTVVTALRVVGQVAVAQNDAGAPVLRFECDDVPGAARRGGVVMTPPPR